MFADKDGAYHRVEHLKGTSLGLAPALPTNIRLGWKGMPGTNAPAYYKSPLWGRLLASPTNIRLGWKGLQGTNTSAYYEKS